MAMNYEAYEKAILTSIDDLFEEEIMPAIVDIATEAVLILAGDPPEGTPQDTQWASANWILHRQPSGSPVGDRTPSGVAQARQAQLESIQMLLDMELEDFELVYLENNVPYIDDLNDGTSPQSDAGFVERGIATAEAFARGRVKRIK